MWDSHRERKSNVYNHSSPGFSQERIPPESLLNLPDILDNMEQPQQFAGSSDYNKHRKTLEDEHDIYDKHSNGYSHHGKSYPSPPRDHYAGPHSYSAPHRSPSACPQTPSAGSNGVDGDDMFSTQKSPKQNQHGFSYPTNNRSPFSLSPGVGHNHQRGPLPWMQSSGPQHDSKYEAEYHSSHPVPGGGSTAEMNFRHPHNRSPGHHSYRHPPHHQTNYSANFGPSKTGQFYDDSMVNGSDEDCMILEDQSHTRHGNGSKGIDHHGRPYNRQHDLWESTATRRQESSESQLHPEAPSHIHNRYTDQRQSQPSYYSGTPPFSTPSPSPTHMLFNSCDNQNIPRMQGPASNYEHSNIPSTHTYGQIDHRSDRSFSEDPHHSAHSPKSSSGKPGGKPSRSAQNLPPCRVCGNKASGLHFGVNTCEACNEFFRRSLKRGAAYYCSRNFTCQVWGKKRNPCSYCRYKRCVEVGMSRNAIKTGRYSHKTRAEYAREIEKNKRRASDETELERILSILSNLVENHDRYIPHSNYTSQEEMNTLKQAFLEKYVKEKAQKIKTDRKTSECQNSTKRDFQSSRSSEKETKDSSSKSLLPNDSQNNAKCDGEENLNFRDSGNTDSDCWSLDSGNFSGHSKPGSEGSPGGNNVSSIETDMEDTVYDVSKTRTTSLDSAVAVEFTRETPAMIAFETENCSPYLMPSNGLQEVKDVQDEGIVDSKDFSLLDLDGKSEKSSDNCNSNTNNYDGFSCSDTGGTSNTDNTSRCDNTGCNGGGGFEDLSDDDRVSIEDKDILLRYDAEVTEVWIRNYIKYAKVIPSFKQLPVADQAILLRSTWFEFWFLGSYPGFSADHQVVTYPKKRSMHYKQFENIYGPDFTDLCFRMADRLRKFSFSREEMVLLKTICLMAPDRCIDLIDQKATENIYWMLLSAMLKLFERNRPGDTLRFPRVVSLMVELRTLSVEALRAHSSTKYREAFPGKPLLREMMSGYRATKPDPGASSSNTKYAPMPLDNRTTDPNPANTSNV